MVALIGKHGSHKQSLGIKKAVQRLRLQLKSQLQQLESTHGVRYSVLMELPYFDPIKFVVIDPMHNLMLGSSKHVLSVWLSEGILNDSKLKIIEDIVKQIQSPHDIGRLPTKLEVDLVVSQLINGEFGPGIALKGIIPEEHLWCWLLLVCTCTILFLILLLKLK